MKHGIIEFPPKPEDFLPLDIKSVWAEMEECQRQGLTKSIGVSNFSCKKLGDLLAFATIPPAVNQVILFFFSRRKSLLLVAVSEVWTSIKCMEVYGTYLLATNPLAIFPNVDEYIRATLNLHHTLRLIFSCSVVKHDGYMRFRDVWGAILTRGIFFSFIGALIVGIAYF